MSWLTAGASDEGCDSSYGSRRIPWGRCIFPRGKAVKNYYVPLPPGAIIVRANVGDGTLTKKEIGAVQAGNPPDGWRLSGDVLYGPSASFDALQAEIVAEAVEAMATVYDSFTKCSFYSRLIRKVVEGRNLSDCVLLARAVVEAKSSGAAWAVVKAQPSQDHFVFIRRLFVIAMELDCSIAEVHESGFVHESELWKEGI